MELLRGALAVVLTFSFAIFIHELGHFMFAKLFGVRVETFSIGFGRKLWSRRRGETEYAISAIPFGGYVKLVGMHSKEIEAILEDERAKDTEKAAQKAARAGGATAATAGAGAEASAAAAGTGTGPEASAPPIEPGQMSAEEAVREAVLPSAAQNEPIKALGETVVEEIEALRSKSWIQKMLIFSAGCINNFLTAVAVFFLMSWIGYFDDEPMPAIVEMVDHVPTSHAGLQPGDRITAVAGEKVDDLGDFLKNYLKFAKEKPDATTIPVTVQRGGATADIQVPLRAEADFPPQGETIVRVGETEVSTMREAAKAALKLQDTTSGPVEIATQTANKETKTYSKLPVAAMGAHWISAAIGWESPPYIAMPHPNLPADRAGMKMGDMIVSVDGVPVKTAEQVKAKLESSVGKSVPVVVKRGEETKALTVEVRENPEKPGKGQIGIAFGAPRTHWNQEPFGKALSGAFIKAANIVVYYLEAVRDLLTTSFQNIRENVGGPIQIGTMFYSAANQNWVYFFHLFALFNIILAVTNLLPLPVFDGGHIVIATIEAVIRRPLPGRVMMHVFNVFFVLIIGLAVLISINDVIMNWWRLR